MRVILAIEIAFDKGWQHLWLETDPNFKQPHVIPLTLHNIRRNYMHILSQMHFKVTHIFKEGNCCAYKMINIGLSINIISLGGIVCIGLFGFQSQ
jgi:hypothetical protein